MAKKLFIDASQEGETRAAIVQDGRLEDFVYELADKRSLKGNVYLARIERVEPSLQAAFLDFGDEFNGFLPFGDIHPDYYRIPVSDQQQLLDEISQDEQERSAELDEELESAEESESVDEGEEAESVLEEDGGLEDAPAEEDKTADASSSRHARAVRRYRIQEVIGRKQLMLVQALKDPRGGKRAAFTTYLSLPGRYCVLMPNTPKGACLSRKIADPKERDRLRDILNDLRVPEGMGVILRTEGMGRTKSEIKRDYDYLLKTWNEIRERTVTSIAPAAIYTEGNLIAKVIRDQYTRDITEVWVDGAVGHKHAKTVMRNLVPSHAKKVKLFERQGDSLFSAQGIEAKLSDIHAPVVPLPSGGYLVITPTEALVSIDVNSGKSTRSRHIEDTALKTNLEAVDEVARQLRLRDLAGLIVIDLIDMSFSKHVAQVERRFKEALKPDRARMQVLGISPLGLLEMSRQRLKPSLNEAMNVPCGQCAGTGFVPSPVALVLRLFQGIEEAAAVHSGTPLRVRVPALLAEYLLNHRRAQLVALEEKLGCSVVFVNDASLAPGTYDIVGGAGQEAPLSRRQKASAVRVSGKSGRAERADDRAGEEDKIRHHGSRDEKGDTELDSTADAAPSSRKRRRDGARIVNKARPLQAVALEPAVDSGVEEDVKRARAQDRRAPGVTAEATLEQTPDATMPVKTLGPEDGVLANTRLKTARFGQRFGTRTTPGVSRRLYQVGQDKEEESASAAVDANLESASAMDEPAPPAKRPNRRTRVNAAAEVAAPEMPIEDSQVPSQEPVKSQRARKKAGSQKIDSQQDNSRQVDSKQASSSDARSAADPLKRKQQAPTQESEPVPPQDEQAQSVDQDQKEVQTAVAVMPQLKKQRVRLGTKKPVRGRTTTRARVKGNAVQATSKEHAEPVNEVQEEGASERKAWWERILS